MDRLEQPENEHSGDDTEGAGDRPPERGRSGRVPPDSRPGHRPAREQDKPDLRAFRERFSGKKPT
jgi:hypothetical protein